MGNHDGPGNIDPEIRGRDHGMLRTKDGPSKETRNNDTRTAHEGFEEDHAKTSGTRASVVALRSFLTPSAVSADPVDPPFCYIVNFDKQTIWRQANDTSTSHEGLEEDQVKTSGAQALAVVFRKFVFVFLTPSGVSVDPVDPPFGTLSILTNQQLSVPVNVFESSRHRNHGAGTRHDFPSLRIFIYVL